MVRIIHGDKDIKLIRLIKSLLWVLFLLFHDASLLIRSIEEIIIREYEKMNNVDDIIRIIRINNRFSDVITWIEIHLGKNPKKGGSPARDKIDRWAIMFLLKFLFLRKSWFIEWVFSLLNNKKILILINEYTMKNTVNADFEINTRGNIHLKLFIEE